MKYLLVLVLVLAVVEVVVVVVVVVDVVVVEVGSVKGDIDEVPGTTCSACLALQCERYGITLVQHDVVELIGVAVSIAI